ncbi:hypothetical protein SGLAM104S_08357 [Streptomyces glaucescens]
MSDNASFPHGPRWFAQPGTARTWRCASAPRQVRDFHAALTGYSPTPLTELPSLATELRIGRVFVKDESCRLGLPAFKALGASWAVHRALAERAANGERRGRVTLVTATDGNHGRAVARMAHLLGQGAHVFVPRGVHRQAVAAIAAERAEVTEVPGNYDDAVRLAAEAAAGPDAVLVQDTAWPGYERIPGWIVEGYSTLCAEIDEQLAAAGVAEGPDLVSIPVGVGSLAQAVVTHYRSRPSWACAGAVVGGAGCRGLCSAQPRPRATRHRRDRRDHHGRAQLRHSVEHRLAVSARRPGRRRRRPRRRQRPRGR